MRNGKNSYKQQYIRNGYLQVKPMNFRRLISIIKHLIAIIFDLKYSFHKEEERLLKTYYTKGDKSINLQEPSIIFMVDGRTTHGGMTDRLLGIGNVYAYCKEKDIPFYIHYVYPFQLSDILVPNTYNWRIVPEKICYDNRYARPVLLNGFQLPVELHRFYLNRLIREKKQIHLYSNTDFLDFYFSQSYAELFKPSILLQNRLDIIHSLIPKPYIAMVFRFQQLFGDFKEAKYKVLQESEQEKLKNRCIAKIKEIRDKEHPGMRVLVTSDSKTFLTAVTTLDFVSIIPGEIVHMDYVDNASLDVYMKSFVDQFMLVDADYVYLLETGDMYHSGFARRGAILGNKPYRCIKF